MSSRKLLYINNQLVDLYPNTVLAQTIQAFELGQLGSVRVNLTNQIKTALDLFLAMTRNF